MRFFWLKNLEKSETRLALQQELFDSPFRNVSSTYICIIHSPQVHKNKIPINVPMNTAISKREKNPSGTVEPSSNPARVLGFYVGKHNNAIIC
jgi:hypothetical protein